jgi:iron complex outermembrane receptor protein
MYDIREINRRTADPTNPLNQIQTGKVRSKGYEMEAVAALNKSLDLIAAYSRTEARVGNGNGGWGARLSSVPEQQASLWTRYKFAFGAGRVSVGGGIRYVGTSWDGADNLETPDFTLFDAMIGYETGPWKASLTINNLADKVHVTTCLSRGDCFYGMRRTVTANLRYSF